MALKINMEHRRPESTVGLQRGKDIEKSEILKGQFHNHIKRFSEANHEERLNELLQNINDQGERVAKTRDMREVLRYKSMISEFLNEVTRGAHTFERQNFLDRRGRHRMYGIVKKVNGKLDELTQEVLKTEKDNIKILKKVEDIRGMLIDLYM